MKTSYVSVVMLVAGLSLVAGGATGQDKKDATAEKIALVKQVLGKAKIDFATALTTAQKKVPKGNALIARTEMSKDNKGRFGFYFLEDGKLQEVEIDVVSGDVVKFEEKKDFAKVKKFAEAQKAAEGSKVSFTQAIEIASEKVKGGKLFEIELEMMGDKGVVEVEFLVGEKITKVRIDAKDPSSVKLH